MPQIPEIIDNRKHFLKDTINHLTKFSTKIEMAAGYFYLSGYNLIKENINPNSEIRIVIGNETDSRTANEISLGYELRKGHLIQSLINDAENLNEEEQKNVYELSELIRDGIITFKIYVKENFHSKAYIFDVLYNNGEVHDAYAIVGSSNFSKRGLGEQSEVGINTELNAVLRQPSAIREVKEWFNEIWNESEDFNEELLKLIDNNVKVEKLEYTPFDILLKTLFSFLKDDQTFEETEKLNLDNLTEFQAFAVRKAIQILKKHEGIIIADSVGLGKTFVANGLLKYFDEKGLNTLIICPASLKPMWEKQVAQFEIDTLVISQESIGKNGLDVNETSNFHSIIIDEAHNFRNENAKRFKSLIQVTMGKKVVQLTATPVNNSIFDLYNILTLFVKEDDFKNKYGIQKLRDIFVNYEQEKDRVSNILNEIVIRRSRTFIKKKYGDANNKISFNGKQLKFPKRHLQKISYDISEVYSENIFGEISEMLELLHLPVISEENLSDSQMAFTKALVKTMFLKRLESSVESFRKSMEKQKKYCNLLLESIKNGYLIVKSDIISELGSDNFEIDENIETISISNFDGDLEELVKNIREDEEKFDNILKKIKFITDERDIKLQTLLKFLQKVKGKKVLLFTEFKDTARYIYKVLLDQDLGYVEEIDSENNKDNRKEKVVLRFAPKANSDVINEEIKNEIDILISTDILSEGQNLQDCNIIVNYDLAWNPVRLIQREGRIDRINTEHEDIYIFNFIPDDKLEEILNLTKRLSEKIKFINETVGNESRIVSEEEILIDKIFNEKDTERIRRISREDNSVIDDMEYERDEILPSEEYIYEDYKELLINNEENKKRASELENGIYSIRKSELYKGIYAYYKAGEEHFWLFYDLLTDSFKTSKAEIYSIISSGNYLKSKPVKRKIEIDVAEILGKCETYINSHVNQIVQVQLGVSEIDKIQKDIAERIENMFMKAKYRSRISPDQRKIRKKLKKPLHKGTIMKLKSLEIEKMSDDDLTKKLDEILQYIDLENQEENSLRHQNIELICYEIFC